MLFLSNHTSSRAPPEDEEVKEVKHLSRPCPFTWL
jgi:hypothetical protein